MKKMMMISSVLLLILLNLTRGPHLAHTRTFVTQPAQPAADAAAGTDSSTTRSQSEPFIKKMRFQVPENARSGSTVKLSCVYELSGASLHAMKLFKDDKEFYRFTPQQPAMAPSNEEQRIAFASPGLKVDLVRSNDQDIWLKLLDKRAAGQYKCQVSIEDTFKSISAEKRMDVIERARQAGAANTMISSWLGSSSPSPSSSHQQQRHAVQHQSQQQQQQQPRNRAQASFMQQQPTSGASSGSQRLAAEDSRKISACWSFVCTILIIVMISGQRHHQQQQQQETPSIRANETPPPPPPPPPPSRQSIKRCRRRQLDWRHNKDD